MSLRARWMAAAERPVHPGVPDHLRVSWGIWDIVLMMVAWFGVQVLVVLLLKVLAPVVPAFDTFLAGVRNGTDIIAIFGLNLLNAAAGFGVVALVLRKYRLGWDRLGWRRTNLWRSLIYMVGMVVVFLIASNLLLLLIQALVPAFKANQPQENDFITAAAAHRWLSLFALVILPPILEETIFRGFLFPALATRWGVVWGAIISSAIFGLAHMQANISIYTFMLGLLLCFMYVRLRSIVPGIVLHMLNNLLAYLALTAK